MAWAEEIAENNVAREYQLQPQDYATGNERYPTETNPVLLNFYKVFHGKARAENFKRSVRDSVDKWQEALEPNTRAAFLTRVRVAYEKDQYIIEVEHPADLKSSVDKLEHICKNMWAQYDTMEATCHLDMNHSNLNGETSRLLISGASLDNVVMVYNSLVTRIAETSTSKIPASCMTIASPLQSRSVV